MKGWNYTEGSVTDLRNLLGERPDELRETARRLIRRQGDDGHWSVAATILGRIEDERLWERYTDASDAPYRSTRQYATEELGLPGDEVMTLLKLWHAMRTAREAGVPFDVWATLPKSRAIILRRAIDAGGDPKRWVEKALAAKTVAEFTEAFHVRAGGKEPKFQRVMLELPPPVADLFEAALVLQLPNVLDEPSPDPARVNDRDVRFRCVEALVMTALNAERAEIVKEEASA